MMAQPRILVALDYRNANEALTLISQLNPALCGLKVGKELFTIAGPAFVKDMVKRGFSVFLDLKFHDIPNTVSAAVSAAADLGVWMVNVHASGGRGMLEAAYKSLQQFGPDRPLLTAVTVLTSLSDQALHEIGIHGGVIQQVNLLAKLTEECGLDGVVCSAQEARLLRKERREGFILVTPGIRLASSSHDDQHRILTPRQAVSDGADYLVIGRPITQSEDPLKTLLSIIEDISYK